MVRSPDMEATLVYAKAARSAAPLITDTIRAIIYFSRDESTKLLASIPFHSSVHSSHFSFIEYPVTI